MSQKLIEEIAYIWNMDYGINIALIIIFICLILGCWVVLNWGAEVDLNTGCCITWDQLAFYGDIPEEWPCLKVSFLWLKSQSQSREQ